MLFQWIWLLMIISALAYGGMSGKAALLFPAALKGAEEALSVTLKMGAGYMLMCGMMEIAQATGAREALERMTRPLLTRLMPHVKREETRQSTAMNLTMNMLGMGNAATPMGMEAMRRMEAEVQGNTDVRHDMRMLLILNATSIQLLPTTVLSLRAAAGSARIDAVVLPTLLCTAVSTVVGAALGLLCQKMGRRKR